jgi:predicted O-methyltransferase YrrM
MTLPIVSFPTKWHIPARQLMQASDASLLVALADDVKPKIVIEFGVHVGLSALTLLTHVPSIDRYIGVDVPQTYQMEIADVAIPEHPGEKVNDPRFQLIIRPRGTRDLKREDLPRADLIFIDGDHGYNSVIKDSELAYDLINSGGMIIWHDYHNPGVEVTQALEELYDDGWDIKAVSGSWIAFERFA